MSIALTHRPARPVRPANWDFGLWLLLGAPVVAALAVLAVALLDPRGSERPDFGYDQWIPADVQADQRGR